MVLEAFLTLSKESEITFFNKLSFFSSLQSWHIEVTVLTGTTVLITSIGGTGASGAVETIGWAGGAIEARGKVEVTRGVWSTGVVVAIGASGGGIRASEEAIGGTDEAGGKGSKRRLVYLTFILVLWGVGFLINPLLEDKVAGVIEAAGVAKGAAEVSIRSAGEALESTGTALEVSFILGRLPIVSLLCKAVEENFSCNCLSCCLCCSYSFYL